jgi:hypothetical protein
MKIRTVKPTNPWDAALHNDALQFAQMPGQGAIAAILTETAAK